jgi:NADH/NAD ratio-sensing transcriptional regulator Rex
MTTDPSWLYSTIAQSSATIVAIIGGFITHSVLTLSAEKKSLIKQHDDAKQRLESLKKHGVDVTIVNMDDLEKNVSSLEARIKAFTYPPNLVFIWAGNHGIIHLH